MADVVSHRLAHQLRAGDRLRVGDGDASWVVDVLEDAVDWGVGEPRVAFQCLNPAELVRRGHPAQFQQIMAADAPVEIVVAG